MFLFWPVAAECWGMQRSVDPPAGWHVVIISMWFGHDCSFSAGLTPMCCRRVCYRLFVFLNTTGFENNFNVNMWIYRNLTDTTSSSQQSEAHFTVWTCWKPPVYKISMVSFNFLILCRNVEIIQSEVWRLDVIAADSEESHDCAHHMKLSKQRLETRWTG